MASNDTTAPDAGDNKQLEQIIEKDTKSTRTPTGLWHAFIAALGGSMVLFYFYTAGVASVGTQFHRGVYVFITFILIFLLYPVGKSWVRYPLNLFVGMVVASAVSAWLFFPDATTFHDRVTGVGEIWSTSGAGAGIAAAFSLWWLAIAAIVVAVGLNYTDRWAERRYPEFPSFSDLLLALTSAGVVAYWIFEFENLNYRAGAETELDALVSVVGIVLSLEICRRVLGWAMTMVGVTMLCYAYFGPYLPEVISHRGFGIERLCTSLYLTTNGVFGVMANVLATYVILFIFFGAFLHKSGAGKFFIEPANPPAGRPRWP